MTIKGQNIPTWALWVTIANIVLTGLVSSFAASFTLGGEYTKIKEFAEHGQQAWEFLFVRPSHAEQKSFELNGGTR